MNEEKGIGVKLAMFKNAIKHKGLKIIMATVGEEELGNLRGVKALFRDHKDIDGFISIDGTAIDRVTNTAAGSHRYEVIFKGPGGHKDRRASSSPCWASRDSKASPRPLLEKRTR